MARSYSIFEITKFPEIPVNGKIIAPFQGVMMVSGEQIQDPPATEVEAISSIPKLDVQVLRITHEMVINQAGRVYDKHFSRFVSESKFPAYYFAQDKVLLLKCKKPVARSAIRMLLKREDIDGYYKVLILDSIRPYIDKLKGAWFKMEDSVDVSSQAFFGPSVDHDIRFSKAMDEGEMNHVRFDYPFKDEQVHVGISSDCTISVFNDDLDEQSELEMILEIKKDLLDKAKVKE